MSFSTFAGTAIVPTLSRIVLCAAFLPAEAGPDERAQRARKVRVVPPRVPETSPPNPPPARASAIPV